MANKRTLTYAEIGPHKKHETLNTEFFGSFKLDLGPEPFQRILELEGLIRAGIKARTASKTSDSQGMSTQNSEVAL